MSKKKKFGKRELASSKNVKRPQKQKKAASEVEAQAQALRKFLFPHATD